MMLARDWLRRQRAQQLVNLGRVHRVEGASNAASAVPTSEADFAFSLLSDAFVAGRPALIFRRPDPPYDFVDESFQQPTSAHGMIKRFIRDFVWPREVEHLDSAICLSLFWSDNYWHWMHENLPKVLLAEAAGFTGHYLVTPAPFARQSLELIGIPPARIVTNDDQIWRVRSLWVSPRLFGSGLIRRQALLERQRAALMAGVGARAGQGKTRFYLSRNRGSLTRRVVNETAVKPVLEKFGFREYAPDGYALSQQIEHFADCEALVGVHGAAFSNALFMPEESLAVGLLSPLYVPTPMTLPVMRLRRHRFHMLVSPVFREPYPHGDDVEVHVDSLDTMLSSELG